MLTVSIILCFLALIGLFTLLYKLDTHCVRVYIESRDNGALDQAQAMNKADDIEQLFIMSKDAIKKVKS